DRRSASLHLARIEQSRERVGHVVEDSCATFQVALAGLPRTANLTGGVELSSPEHVRVTSHQLLMRSPRNVLYPQLALLRQEEGEEVHLAEQVAEVVRDLLVI